MKGLSLAVVTLPVSVGLTVSEVGREGKGEKEGEVDFVLAVLPTHPVDAGVFKALEAPKELLEGVGERVRRVGVGAMEVDRDGGGVGVLSVGVGATDSVKLMLARRATVWLGVNVEGLGVGEGLKLE